MRPIIAVEPTQVPGCCTLPGRCAVRQTGTRRARRCGRTILPPVKAIRRFTVRTVLPDGPRPPGRAGAEPALVLGHRDPAAVHRASTPRCGTRSAATRSSCSVPSARSGSPALAADPDVVRRVQAAADDLQAYLEGDRWYQRLAASATGEDDAVPSAIAYFSPEYGITAALPQYSGGLGILAGDHLKAASDLGVPDRGGRPALPVRLLRPVAVPRGLAAGALPGARPQRAADLAAARGRRRPAQGAGRAARRAPAGGPGLEGAGRPGAAAAARLRRRGQRARPSATSPTGSTAAAASTGCCRRCCSASAASARCARTAG